MLSGSIVSTALVRALGGLLACVGIAFAPGVHAQDRPTLDTLDARLARVERVLDQSLLQQLQRVDELERELRELRGENEGLANELDQLVRRDRELYTDTDRRLTDLEESAARQASYGIGPDGLPLEPGLDGDDGEGSDGPLDLTGVGGGAGQGGDEGGGEPLDAPADLGSEPEGQDPRGAQDGQPARSDAAGSLGTFTGGAGAVGPLALSDADYGDGPRPPAGRVRDTATQAEKTAYTQAYDLLARGRNDEAVERFDAFLREYPDGPYSDNAWYWQGEAMYADRRFDEAVRNFRTVVDAFPNSAKQPDARLKIGYSLYEQADYGAARRLLATVRDEYPGRSAAVLARKRLQQMDREGR